MQPIISIIIPVFNIESLLGETLESIQNQDFNQWECIVIDDGSTDSSLNVAKKFESVNSKFKIFKRPKHIPKGPNGCRNYGFEKSLGQWILWLDGDDLLTSNALQSWQSQIEEKYDGIIAPLQFVKHHTLEVIKQNQIYSENLISDYLVGNVSFYVCGGLWNRNFLDKQTELFDISLRNLDDWDFNLRLLYQNPVLKFSKNIAVLYRRRQGSLTDALEKLSLLEIESEIMARKKHINLLKTTYPNESKILSEYLTKRILFFYKRGMIENNPERRKIYRLYLKQLKSTGDFFGILKSYFGFIFYLITNRGYFLLR